jgi:hypothetical protein
MPEPLDPSAQPEPRQPYEPPAVEDMPPEPETHPGLVQFVTGGDG